MATVKISALTTITGASVDQANDVIPIVDATGPETKKITVAQLLGLVSTSITVGTTTTTGTTGSVLFCDTGVVQQDNTNLFWDNTNNRLSIGATSPNATLEVRAPGALSTSYAVRVRNSANTQTLYDHTGDGAFAYKLNNGELALQLGATGLMCIGNAIIDTDWAVRISRVGTSGSKGNLYIENATGGSTPFYISKTGAGGGTAASILNADSAGFNTGLYVQSTGAGTVNWGVRINAANATGGAGTNLALKLDAGDIAFDNASGHRIGVATTQKIGFWNATPIVQPASANQATLTNSTGGTYDATLAAVSGTGDDATINNNFTDIYTLLNAMRTAMVDAGLMKGAA